MVATVYIFSDESGNFDFSGGPGASRYFTLATASANNCQYGDQLLALRRRLAWRGEHLEATFHATYDHGRIRMEVLRVLAAANVEFHATVFDKQQAPAELRTEEDLYDFAWRTHLSRIAPQVVSADARLLVVASDLGTKKRRGRLFRAVQDAVTTTVCAKRFAAFWPNASDPCLWAADYACWAIHRAHERQDDTFRSVIASRIRSEELHDWS